MSQKIATAKAELLNAGLPNSVLIEQLNQLFAETSRDNLLWTSGYCYGLAQQKNVESLPVEKNNLIEPEQKTNPKSIVWVAYGSQTGNAKQIAGELADLLGSNQISIELKSFADIQPRQLKNCDILLAVVSTQGEGEPPEDSIVFFENLLSKRAPNLSHLHFSVLGLGDSSYEFFCETSKQLDKRLIELNAIPILARIDADIDYQNIAKQWQESLLSEVKKKQATSQNENAQPKLSVVTNSNNQKNETLNNTQSSLVNAEVLVNQKITGRTSSKSIHHLEFEVDAEKLNYLPGDALGIVVKNSEQQVEQIIKSISANQSTSIAQALIEKKEITRLHPKVIQAYAAHQPKLSQAIESEGREFLLKLSNQYQLIDLLQEYPVELSSQSLLDILHSKAERLYSIASSLEAYPDEVHLTVAGVEYQKNDQQRFGSGSQYCLNLEEGQSVEVYLKQNQHFRLPENTDAPIIMVGPGTGIAPFRGFLQHRQALNHQGKNWLFFGNPHFHSDFLYQLEWQKLLKDKCLTQMDVAFSRDQSQKIYVQHRLKEKGKEVFDWLENGASFYLCGDATTMAKDVEQSLLDLISLHSAKDNDFAKDYLNQMRSEKRFLKDVY